MSQMDKMHTGELYLPQDGEILEQQTKCLDRLYDYNNTRPTEGERRAALLKEMFAEIGEHDKEFYFRQRRIPPELKDKYGL